MYKNFDDIQDIIKLVENSSLCQGLPQDDENKSRVVDPTCEKKVEACTKSTIVHSVHKLLCETHFYSSVTFRSPDCGTPDVELCCS